MTGIPDPQFPDPQRKRRSSIAQSATASDPAVGPPADPPGPPPNRATVPRPTVAVQPDRDAHRKGGTRDILLSLPDDAKERMVRTIAFTMPYTGIRHQQVFIRRAIDELCSNLEGQYNGGDPFPEIAQ